MHSDPRVIVALDVQDMQECRRLTASLQHDGCSYKIGKELFCSLGPAVLHAAPLAEHRLFLDLKFHDIPRTVARAVASAARHGVWMLTVHTLGGLAMLKAARKAADEGPHRPLIIGVTVLTSLDDGQLQAVGISRSVAAEVRLLTELACEAQLDGIVCAAGEAAAVKRLAPPGFLTITPGIRPARPWGAGVQGRAAAFEDDQRRVMTPGEAIRSGADYLVVGRPVTCSQDPHAALLAINQEVTAALEQRRSE